MCKTGIITVSSQIERARALLVLSATGNTPELRRRRPSLLGRTVMSTAALFFARGSAYHGLLQTRLCTAVQNFRFRVGVAFVPPNYFTITQTSVVARTITRRLADAHGRDASSLRTAMCDLREGDGACVY